MLQPLKFIDSPECWRQYNGIVNIASLWILITVLTAMASFAVIIGLREVVDGASLNFAYLVGLTYIALVLIAMVYKWLWLLIGILIVVRLVMLGLVTRKQTATKLEESEVIPLEIKNYRLFSVLRLEVEGNCVTVPSFLGWFEDAWKLARRKKEFCDAITDRYKLHDIRSSIDVRIVALILVFAHSVLPLVYISVEFANISRPGLVLFLLAASTIISIKIFGLCFMSYSHSKEGMNRALPGGFRREVLTSRVGTELHSIVLVFDENGTTKCISQLQSSIPLPALKLLLDVIQKQG